MPELRPGDRGGARVMPSTAGTVLELDPETGERRRARSSLAATLVALALAVPRPVGAAEVVLQNDSVTDFGSVAIQVGFVAGESAAAWLTSVCDGDLTKVQVLWLSFTGGAPDTLGESVSVFEAGAFPVPGPQLVVLDGPLMQDGFFNEFTLPAPIPVAIGETVVVAFQFLSNPPALGPSVVTDVDGCMAGKNSIFAIPPNQWVAACPLGLSGDFAIRAVVDCPDATLIFADGFESGDTSAWSGSAP